MQRELGITEITGEGNQQTGDNGKNKQMDSQKNKKKTTDKILWQNVKNSLICKIHQTVLEYIFILIKSVEAQGRRRNWERLVDTLYPSPS